MRWTRGWRRRLVAEATSVPAHRALRQLNLESRRPAASATAILRSNCWRPVGRFSGLAPGIAARAISGSPARAWERSPMEPASSANCSPAAPASWQGSEAHLPWVKRPSPVFLAASGPKAGVAGAGGRGGCGVGLVNFGRAADNMRCRPAAAVFAGAAAAGRDPGGGRDLADRRARLQCRRRGDAPENRARSSPSWPATATSCKAILRRAACHATRLCRGRLAAPPLFDPPRRRRRRAGRRSGPVRLPVAALRDLRHARAMRRAEMPWRRGGQGLDRVMMFSVSLAADPAAVARAIRPAKSLRRCG